MAAKRTALALAAAAAVLPLSCGGDGDGEAGAAADEVTLYTCASDEPVQAVIEDFESANPGTNVALFRAPTGELNAKVAAEVRSGGLRADVVWGCDPLTMQSYVDQDLIGGWTPDNAEAIPASYRTDDYVGVALLYMVAVHNNEAPAPKAWSDLYGEDYTDAVAVPDPSFAASALGALGYFAQAEGYGIEFYAALRDNGAVQVATPDEVTTGVAQGVYRAGMTIANSAYLAQENGSPIGVVWPEPGAIAIYGPIALATERAESALAQDFIEYVVSEEGQTALAEAGSYPTLPGVPGPTIPEDAPIVLPDWDAIAAEKDALLSDYQQIFPGG
jgi:iron(III) transport system substrate-binding protein